jgi:hypothetical protein
MPLHSETEQYSGQRELRSENLRFRARACYRESNDWVRFLIFWPLSCHHTHLDDPLTQICFDTLLSCPGDHAHVAKVRRGCGYLERGVYLCGDVGGSALVPWKGP